MGTQRPRVSVVMSVRDDAERVRRAIQSIRSQTFTDWELIVIDDGSRDGTGTVLDELVTADGRIRAIHQEQTGLTRALIRGCAESRGEFIARQDADDLSGPPRLERQVSLLDANPDAGFVSCWTQYIGPENEPLELVTRPADSEEATRQLLVDRQGPPAHGSVMFRRALYEKVNGYRPEFYFAQDADLWLRMAERAKIGYVPQVLYYYRRDYNSISGTFRPMQRRFGEVGQACRKARLTGQPEAPHLAAAAALTEEILRAGAGVAGSDGAPEMSYLIGSRLARDRDRRAVGYLWKAIRDRRWYWRALGAAWPGAGDWKTGRRAGALRGLAIRSFDRTQGLGSAYTGRASESRRFAGPSVHRHGTGGAGVGASRAGSRAADAARLHE